MERDVLVEELQFYFDSSMAAQIPQEQILILDDGTDGIVGSVDIKRNGSADSRVNGDVDGDAGHEDAVSYLEGKENRISGVYLYHLQFGPERGRKVEQECVRY